MYPISRLEYKMQEDKMTVAEYAKSILDKLPHIAEMIILPQENRRFHIASLIDFNKTIERYAESVNQKRLKECKSVKCLSTKSWNELCTYCWTGDMSEKCIVDRTFGDFIYYCLVTNIKMRQYFGKLINISKKDIDICLEMTYAETRYLGKPGEMLFVLYELLDKAISQK